MRVRSTIVICTSLSFSSLFGQITAGAGNSVQDATKRHEDLTKVWTHSQEHGWLSSIDLALNSTSGNSSSGYYTAGVTLDKKRGQNQYDARFSYAYGEEGGNKSLDELLAMVSWKRTGSGGYYTGIRLDYRQDSLADIHYRLAATLLQGYQLYTSEKGWLTPEIGVGYTLQEVSGQQSEKPNVYLGLHAEYWLNKKTRLYTNNTLFIPFESSDEYYYWGELGIETLLSERLSLKFYLQDSYDASPAEGKGSNDMRVIAGISIRL